jgi:hypothetical protein
LNVLRGDKAETDHFIKFAMMAISVIFGWDSILHPQSGDIGNTNIEPKKRAIAGEAIL